MRFSILLGLLLVIVVPAVAWTQAEDREEWSSVHFEDLVSAMEKERSTGAMVVAMAVQVVSERPDSRYRHQLETGQVWACVSTIIDAIVEHQSRDAGAEYPPESYDQDAPFRDQSVSMNAAGENSPFGVHSGKRWRFWQRLAHLGELAYESELEVELGDDAVRILAEMKTSFTPLLDPEAASAVFFGSNAREKTKSGD